MNKITDPLDLRKRIEVRSDADHSIIFPPLEYLAEAATPLRKYSYQQRLDRLEDKLRAAIAMVEVNENLLSGRFLEYLQTLAIAVQNCRRSIIVRTLPRHCWRQSWRYQCQKRML